MKHLRLTIICAGLLLTLCASAQTRYYLQPDRVFDGENLHSGWAVIVEGSKIAEAGPSDKVKPRKGDTVLRLPDCTLLPGLIEGHSHVLLHPYNEVSWTEQVLYESDALRVARATVHLRKTLEAGFTTMRDLGSEGAGYADVGLKRAIDQGIIVGPRMLVAGRAIVATGSYGPSGFDTDFEVMLGAEPGDGNDLIRIVRDQIGKGADIVKVYGDYRWGASGETRPTFSVEELKLIVETARSSGRPVVAHAAGKEGMLRAIAAGVETIEHGDDGDAEVFRLMKEKHIALCPTLAAGDAIQQYHGWKKGRDQEPESIRRKRQSFREALQAGVPLVMGGDVGVYAHGDNVREMEMMVDYGMTPLLVLTSATHGNAVAFHLEKQIGSITPGLLADILVVKGNPAESVSSLRNVQLVMKDGIIYFQKP